jgi:phosphohistidine swiveling domain-containing protein
LQARPETVWSNRQTEPDGWRQPNVFNSHVGPQWTWTTTNAAEALPGIQTPLGISLFDEPAEYSFRSAYHAIGALSDSELDVPQRADDRLVCFFFGRIALNLNVICSWADRIPGTTGRGMAEQIFSHVPDDYQGRARYAYYPRVAAKMTTPFFRYPTLVRDDRRIADAFWRKAQRQLPDADQAIALQFLVDARAAVRQSLVRHTTLVMGAVQPAYDMLEKLAAPLGLSASTLMSGHGGHEETEVLDDVWECSRGRLSLPDFLLRHGYHGPNEGDVSATVWRENPEPVRTLIESYRTKTDAPNADAGERTRRRKQAEADFIARLPRLKRPAGRAAIALAGKYVPMRGIGKVAFLQGVDVARAATRRVGELLATAGKIDNPEDAFFLTIDELNAGCPANARDLIAERRGLYAHYRTIDLPTFWRGTPEPATVEFDTDAESLEGTGASPGVVDGVVRVVDDPATATIGDGEILVANCTDPSWASLMFLSAGLITDIGGVMSHTAVVAREMSIPCVVNTKIATQLLKDGDRVRMDGSNGRIQILERAHEVPR